MRMIRASIAILFLIGLADAAAARDLVGRFGYLGEWDVTASLTEEKAASGSASTSAPAYAGSLVMKHNAVCGPGETPEKSGHIRMSLRGTRYTAQMMLAGTSCDFSGTLSQSAHVFVTCGGEGRIPLRLWFK